MKISLAYSPDTDDAFMVRALRERLIDCGKYSFDFVSEDIQVLNQAALGQTYDISAISIAAYPNIAADYWLMPIGASIGEHFGPAVVTTLNSQIKTVEDLQNRRIAVPGLQTSAYLAALALIGPFTAVPMRFDLIAAAVRRGEVDAGILIHELQINCESAGLHKINDLGTLWDYHFQLPLPLGGIAIRRSLGNNHVKALTDLYKRSIEYALTSRQTSLTIAIDQAKTTLDHNLADRYIDMYVNHNTLQLAPRVIEGIDRLFAAGATHGLHPTLQVANHISVPENLI